LHEEKIPYVYYVFSVEGLTDSASHFDNSGRLGSLVFNFLVPAFQGLPPQEIARQVALCVSQYRYGFALAALRALGHDPAASHRLRGWSTTASRELIALIHGIQSHPGPYRRYAATNHYFGWNHATKLNELLANYFSSPAAKANMVPKEYKVK
jgi:hypothetical protein